MAELPCAIAGLFHFKNDYIGRGEHTTLTAGNAPHLAEPPFFLHTTPFAKMTMYIAEQQRVICGYPTGGQRRKKCVKETHNEA